MDVKIGKKSYDPDACAEKIQQQISKYPLMEEIGFLLLGMRVYQLTSDNYVAYDQCYGRGLTQETLKDGKSLSTISALLSYRKSVVRPQNKRRPLSNLLFPFCILSVLPLPISG
uniref:Kinase n=1 Tax=Callorhinchus milii TaxID=7868 RepID=A0A4W3K7E7_CALMI